MLKSLRWKLMFMAIVLVLATVIPLLFTTTWMMEETVSEKHEQQVKQEAKAMIHLIESYYDAFRQNLEMFSHSPLLASAEDAKHKFVPAKNAAGHSHGSKPQQDSHKNESQHGSDKVERHHDADKVEQHHDADEVEQHHDADEVEQHHDADEAEQHHDADEAEQHHDADEVEQHHDADEVEQHHDADKIEQQHRSDKAEHHDADRFEPKQPEHGHKQKQGGHQGASQQHSHGSGLQGIQQHIYEKFKEFGTAHKGVLFTFFGSRHGGLISYPEDTRTDFDPRKRNWYKQAVANNGKMIQTAPYIDQTSKKRVISLAQVVSGPGQEVAGVAAFDINNDFLEQTVQKVRIGKSGYVVLLHKSGVVIADAHYPANNMKKLSQTSFAGNIDSDEILNGEKDEFSVKLDNTEYHVHCVNPGNSNWIVMVFMDHEELLTAAVDVRNRLLFTAILVALAVCLFSFFAASRLLKPINSMMKDLAAFEGDLTMRFKVQSKDEIGELAKWFNVFLEKLQKLLHGVQGETENVNSSAGGLGGIATTLLENAKGTSSRANTVAAAAEKMNANINNVAAAMEQSSTNISMVASAAEEMTANINDIAGSVRSAAEISRSGVAQAQQTSSRMGELDEAAQAISEVTNTITEISEQTNLLALNATIEAARAGEAGKGFAVVANEIKELARQTAEATGNIRDKINGVQQTSNASIGAINDIVGIINKINEIITKVTDAIDQQSMTTREIAENINQASLGLNEVNENVNQSSVVSASISKEIAEVNTASSEFVAHGEELNSHSESLRTLADSLQKLVGVFKI